MFSIENFLEQFKDYYYTYNYSIYSIVTVNKDIVILQDINDYNSYIEIKLSMWNIFCQEHEIMKH